MMKISLIINIESNEMTVMKNKRKIIIKGEIIQTKHILTMGHKWYQEQLLHQTKVNFKVISNIILRYSKLRTST